MSGSCEAGADAATWRDAVIADADSVKGRDIAARHQVPVSLVIAGAELIAAYMGRGQSEIDHSDLAAFWSDKQVARLLRYLVARGHIRRDRDLVEPIRVTAMPDNPPARMGIG
jgi:hypothetical protein